MFCGKGEIAAGIDDRRRALILAAMTAMESKNNAVSSGN
jgi:hypothetical protein